MSYTVAASFEKFRENIEVSGDHREIASKRRDRIVSLLSNSFDIIEAFPSGSISRYTAVKGYADLDVMVALHYSKHVKDKSPSQVLQSVRDCLGEYRTNVRKNGQAVTLYYETWPNVDIVPVFQTTDASGNITHYNVPDLSREVWIVSNPKIHTQDMLDKNNSCGANFKRIVKMIKWWNHQHSSLLQSFHIEVLALKIYDSSLNDYSWDVFQFFDKASKLATLPMWHNGSFVDAYLDSKTRTEAVKRLETARDKARDAWHKTYNGRDDHADAIEYCVNKRTVLVYAA